METLIWPTINFLVLIGILTYFLRTPLKEYVTSRHDRIKENVGEVREKLREAQLKFDELSSKLQAVSTQSESIRQDALKKAQTMKDKMITHSKELASTIVANARSNSHRMASNLRIQLRSEFAEKIITQAEAQIKNELTGNLKQKFNNSFSSGVRK